MFYFGFIGVIPNFSAVRPIAIILLLNLLLLPLIWNGVNFIHYLVEHTHTFCESEQNHQHTSAEDCHTICHISPQPYQGQIPVEKIEFYELKQYITTFPLFLSNQFSYCLLLFLPILIMHFFLVESSQNDIFRPPIS